MISPGVRSAINAGRASIEDKPLMSENVFLRAWLALGLPHFNKPVTNLQGPNSPTFALQSRKPFVYRHHTREEVCGVGSAGKWRLILILF